MSQRIVGCLKERLGDKVLSTHSHRGDDTVLVTRAAILEVAQLLHDDPALLLDLPTDLTAVDFLGREPRFEVVYHFYSTTHKHRVRIKCPVPEEDPTIASLYTVFPGTRWFERETFDMYGIKFVGHPDLRRMFMYDEFVGHPLRKDYPKERRQPLIRRDGAS